MIYSRRVLLRGPFAAALAVVTLFLLFELRESWNSQHATSSSASSLHGAIVQPSYTRWADIPTKYPVSRTTSLPHPQLDSLPTLQHTFEPETPSQRFERQERQQKVKATFQKCWRSYRERAWMQDELRPLSGGSHRSFGGWAATLVDSLDTLYIMDMKTELAEAILAVRTIDFSKSEDLTINVFETTIRYLGGFLAAFDLTAERSLLDKAVEVGDMLFVAFDTPNHMPVSRWDWQNAKMGTAQEAPVWALVSEIGSLSLEFTRLSQLTGNPKYFDAIQRITDVFDEQQATTTLPGMWPMVVNPHDNLFNKETTYSLGGMSDSLYEYFPKQYALLGGSSQYRKLYENSMTTAIRHAFFRPMTPDNANILMSGDVKAQSPEGAMLDPHGQHLGCFTGGMLALGGRLFNISEHIDVARKLTNGCVWAYNAMPHGIMPETFYLIPCLWKDSCEWDEQRWHQAVMNRAVNKSHTVDELITLKRLPPGFSDIDDKRYILRPEAIESVFLLYRITGDRSYQEAAWKMFCTIQNLTETEYGNAALNDVTVTATEPQQVDSMESFWMAETLKYFYLVFSEPSVISLDEFVFNTEAHPFRRPSSEAYSGFCMLNDGVQYQLSLEVDKKQLLRASIEHYQSLIIDSST